MGHGVTSYADVQRSLMNPWYPHVLHRRNYLRFVSFGQWAVEFCV